MDNSAMKPSEIFYGKTPEAEDSDAISTTDEVVTETEAAEVAPIEGEAEIDKPKIEGSENAELGGDENLGEQEESFYVDIDGEEISFEQINEWKSGHMMQADYTRGKQEVAEQRKALEAGQAELANKSESLKLLVAELQAEIGTKDEVNMEELREYDPGEYLKQKELQDKREKLLSKAKESFNTTTQVSDADVTAERELLVKANPQWIDDKGAATDVYKADMASLDKYLGDNGWTQEEFSTVYQSKHVNALIKAAKFDALQGKQNALSKKVKEAPVIRKGKQAAKAADESVESITDIFYPKK